MLQLSDDFITKYGGFPLVFLGLQKTSICYGFDGSDCSAHQSIDIRRIQASEAADRDRKEIAVAAGKWVGRALKGHDRRGESGRRRLALR